MAVLTFSGGRSYGFLTKRVRFLCRIVLAVLLTALMNSVAGGQSSDEYHLKAAFLYNFIKFVDWPPEAFTSPSEPFAICLLGRNPFGEDLNDAVAGKVVAGRSITIRTIPEVRQRGGRCQILFVGSSEPNLVASVLRETRASCILTVGEAEDFAVKGGVIGFTIKGGKVHFEINVAAAEQEGLRISSKLLSLARIVRKGHAH